MNASVIPAALGFLAIIVAIAMYARGQKTDHQAHPMTYYAWQDRLVSNSKYPMIVALVLFILAYFLK